MYTFNGRIRYSEIDHRDQLTLPALINYFQDCSTFHSEDVGMGHKELMAKNRAWILSYWQVEITRYPKLCERVQVGTFATDFQKFLGYRNFLMKTGEGEELAKAYAVWVYMDMVKGRPVRLPKEEADACLLYTSEQISFGLLGGQNVEVKAVLSFDALIRTRTQQKVLREVDLTPFTREEMERRPGIVGYIVKEGDTLWDLAKRYQTTEEKIKAVNGMEREELEKGEKLILY